MASSNRKRWIAGGVAATLVMAVVVAYQGCSALRTIRATQTSAGASAALGGNASEAASVPDKRGSGIGAGATGPVLAEPPPRPPRGVPSLGEMAARTYRERARLPADTEALDGSVDPVADAQEVSPHRAGGPEGEGPYLTAYPTRVNYEAPERVIVRAYFTDDGETVAAESLTVRFIQEVAGEVATIVMNDDGRAGDDVAGDLVYSAALRPIDQDGQALAGTYVASVRGATTELVERAVSTGFLYSAPSARPTGRFRDRIQDGSLILEAEIEVFATGRFHAEATLAEPKGQTIAWAQTAERLDPGLNWMALRFYGLVFRDKGIDGPYLVRSFGLSTTGGMPNQKNRILTNAHTTAAYRVDRFTDKPFEDPDLLEAARRAEGDGLGQPASEPAN